jgi:DNA-binding NtrC family response regulator
VSGTQAIETPAVLFVDDDREVLDAYRRDMAAERIVAEFVQSAERALARIRSQSPPDVVVCDILMPGMSGSELFYRVKAMDASWERRFVFVTGASSMSHVVEFLSGTDARVLHKPVDIDRLRHAISYAALARRVFSDARLRGR